MKKIKQIMALLLCGIMVTAQTSFTVRAEAPIGQGGLCEHHPVHTQECGYTPADPGAPCTHTHDDDCFISVKNCIHVHTAECYSAIRNGSGGHTCRRPAGREPVNCTHVCSAESGCITQQQTVPMFMTAPADTARQSQEVPVPSTAASAVQMPDSRIIFPSPYRKPSGRQAGVMYL